MVDLCLCCWVKDVLGKGRGKRTQNAQKVLDSPHIWDRQKADFNTIPLKVTESLPT
jgi:hypothetical protein